MHAVHPPSGPLLGLAMEEFTVPGKLDELELPPGATRLDVAALGVDEAEALVDSALPLSAHAAPLLSFTRCDKTQACLGPCATTTPRV
jgi:hypothetical protein